MRRPRLLVIQLCRLGDILQTTPMLRGLRRQHPDAHVTLMLLDGFGRAPVPPHLYDALVLFPFDLVSGLTTAVPSRWQEALDAVRSFLRSIGDEPFDRTLNVTSSHASNLLAALIPSRDVQGGIIAPDRTRVVRGPWMTYFWSSLQSRAHGCINIVDLFTWMAGVQADRRGLEVDVPADARDRMRAWLCDQDAYVGPGFSPASSVGPGSYVGPGFSPAVHPSEPLIAVQLGASDERKRWPPEQVAAALNRIPPEWGRVVFVGTHSERSLADRAIAALERPYLNACGTTTLPELGALLGHARVLLTNDTGTMHVAAAVGTRIVDLSTGPVFVHETGPYGEGHVAVEPASACFPCAAGSACSHLSCRDDFGPDDIAAVMAYALGEAAAPALSRARVLRSRFAPSGRLVFERVSGPGTDAERLRMAMAAMWEQTLPAPGVREAARVRPGSSGSRMQALEALAAEAEAGGRTADRLRSASAAAQPATAAEIDRHLRRLALMGQLHPECHPIVAYLQVAIESITERAVEQVAAGYHRELRRAGARARLLAELLNGEHGRAGQAA